jgi:hypothetical protein
MLVHSKSLLKHDAQDLHTSLRHDRLVAEHQVVQRTSNWLHRPNRVDKGGLVGLELHATLS